MNRTLNIAHRGFSGVYPENTMLAFRKAVEAGADGIETDLHVTRDGVIVVCHDETLDRTTSGTGFIKDRTYEYIRRLDAGSGEKIPSLDEILNYMKDKQLLLNLELKNDIVHYDNLEKNVIDKIYKYSMESNVILSSFNHDSMKRVKEYDGSIKTGLLYGSPIYRPEEYARKMGADALHPLFSLVMNEKIVDDIKKNGILINAYTVNRVDDMRKLMDLKVDGIITNYPNILKKLI